METIELLSGFEELLNHVSLGEGSILMVRTTMCCATGTCDPNS